MAANLALKTIQEPAWRGGFGNLLRKELGQWWGTRQWWVHALIWTVLINGFVTLIAVTEPETAQKFTEATAVFFMVGGIAMALEAVVTTQGALIGERQSGTAAWVLSKPTARGGVIIAKLVAAGLGLLSLALLLQAPLYAAQMLIWTGRAPEAGALLAAVGIQALTVLFYLALTLLLGAVFTSRGPVAGIGVGVAVAGTILTNLLPPAVTLITPWSLPRLAATVALGQPTPDGALISIVATALWTVAFIAITLWRFQREEF